MGYLEGLKVIDLGSALAAPYSATLLADLGAEVIKIEKPRRGDLIRFTDEYVQGESGYFLGINRGKDSVTVDVRKPEGQQIIREMIAGADVLVENFRAHRMAEWNLDYDSLKELNAGLIYCSVSAFGDAAGYEEAGGNDIIAQAWSGLMDLTGEADEAPSRTGSPVVDVSGAYLATIGILGALHRRHLTGEGSHIKVSLLEAAYATMPNYITSVLNGRPDFKRCGSGHPQLAPYRAYETADRRHMVIGAFHRSSWLALCAAIGRNDLAADLRFKENQDRVENRAALDAILEEEMRTRSRDEWLDLFRDQNILAAPVMTIGESIRTFQNAIPGLVVRTDHAKLGKLDMLRTPISFSDIKPGAIRAAPVLGEDTDRRLRELGHGSEEIAAWREARII